jgi:hypothetical protein
MNSPDQQDVRPWSLLKKIVFRFFLIYFISYYALSWSLYYIEKISGIEEVTKYHSQLNTWVVKTANKNIFHIKEVLLEPTGGSGDTSFGWAELCFYLCLSLVISLVWSILDRKRDMHAHTGYWLRTGIRYFLITVLFFYGIIKIFPLQMSFPDLSGLSSTLGDLAPMRLAWFFIGYSTPYQMFSGMLEVLAALLLLNRRTATLGLLVATGVFLNIVMLNLCYDVVVKIFSINLLLFCVILLCSNYKRLVSFFILNLASPPDTLFEVQFRKKWMRLTRIAVKALFIILAIAWPFYDTWKNYEQYSDEETATLKPIRPGIYDVKVFALNTDTIPMLVNDTLRWKDVIFETGGYGSINTQDTLFRKRYRRGYFSYKADTVEQTLNIKKRSSDTTFLFRMHYEIPDSTTIKLWTILRKDSLYMELVKSNRTFLWTKKQFNWVSAGNKY